MKPLYITLIILNTCKDMLETTNILPLDLIFFFMARQSLVGLDFLDKFPRSHSDTPQSAEFLWTIYRPVAETCYLTTHNSHERRMSLPPAILESAVPASEQP